MFGIALAALSSALSELSDSIGKRKMGDGAVSIYTFGFLNLLFGTIFIIAFGALRHDLTFSLSSLPTFLPRLGLEILQAHVTALAVMKSERGDFGIVRSMTIPLLLIVDLALGYTVTSPQMLGIGLIISTIVLLLSFEKFRTKGLWLLIVITVNPVLTLSLYKYDITYFNSVEAEQAIVGLILAAYFFVLALVKAKENPLSFLRRPAFVAQTSASGLSYVANSFAYTFAPASVIIAAVRGSAVLFAVISGKLNFEEQGFPIKMLLFLVVTLGLVFLVW